MHPYLKWALIGFVVIMLVAPTLAADMAHGLGDGIQGAIESLKTFGNAF